MGLKKKKFNLFREEGTSLMPLRDVPNRKQWNKRSVQCNKYCHHYSSKLVSSSLNSYDEPSKSVIGKPWIKTGWGN